MRRVADSAVIQTQLVLNSHLNGAGRLFGGQLMEWIDIVATVVARRHAHCNPTTASVDNLQFKEAVHLNNTLIIEGKLTYVGRTSMEVRVDTFVESLSGARKLVNKSSCYRYGKCCDGCSQNCIASWCKRGYTVCKRKTHFRKLS